MYQGLGSYFSRNLYRATRNAVSVVLPLSLAVAALQAHAEQPHNPELSAAHTPTKLSSSISVQQMLGECLIVGFRGTSVTADSPIIQSINQYHLGGVILFDYDTPTQTFQRNIIDPEQTTQLIADLKRYANHPIWVAIDAEGGKVNRLKARYGFKGTTIPSAWEVGQETLDEAYETYMGFAKTLYTMGFNLNFAPVVDLARNADNPVIVRYGRSFGADPKKVAAYAQQFVRAHEHYHIATALKHFPGHGSSTTDSHLDTVDITKTFDGSELTPYRLLIDAHAAPMVMTGHLFNQNWDTEYPATFSRTILQTQLRNVLKYKGIIVSDDLHMQAASMHRPPGECALLALQAGVDLLIFSNNAPGQPYDEQLVEDVMRTLTKALEDGTLSGVQARHRYNALSEMKKRYIATSTGL
ncbi:MAG: glycoside hydrolase family 3 N-terminal domain-containing protein [Pseudomonadota bacterium]